VIKVKNLAQQGVWNLFAGLEQRDGERSEHSPYLHFISPNHPIAGSALLSNPTCQLIIKFRKIHPGSIR